MPTMIYKNAAGERVPGVTTVISKNLGWNKQALMWWANQMGLQGKSHREEATAAADAGTCGHYLIECKIKHREPDLTRFDEATLAAGQQALENFERWAKGADFEVVKAEDAFVSKDYQYGGCIDIVAYIQEHLAIADLKTSKAVYPDHLIQLAAYEHGWNEINVDNPISKGNHILSIGREDARFSHKWYGDLTPAWEAFKHLLALDKLQKQIKP